MQRPERRPGSLLRRSLEAAFDVTVLDFKFSLGINGTRCVVNRDFFTVELGRSAASIGVLFLFAFKFERTIGDDHVLFGAVGAVVVRRSPVVCRVPLFLVEACAVEVVFEHFFPTAKIRRRVGERERRRQSHNTRDYKTFFHIQSSPNTCLLNILSRSLFTKKKLSSRQKTDEKLILNATDYQIINFL